MWGMIESMQGDMEAPRGAGGTLQPVSSLHLARAAGDLLCSHLIRKDGQKDAGDRLLFKGGGHVGK